MQNLKAAQLMALVAGLGSVGVGNNVEVLTRGSDYVPLEFREREHRNSAFRKGRRWGYGISGPVRKGGNPAGTKLAKKAAKGTLTMNGIR